MHAFDVLGDPVRRRILELLADDGEQTAGAVTAAIQAEFGISQPAVSQHLRVLRENGFTTVRAAGTRRLYAVDDRPLQQVHDWLQRFWNQRLDALGTELARGRRQRRRQQEADAGRDTESGTAASGAAAGKTEAGEIEDSRGIEREPAEEAEKGNDT